MLYQESVFKPAPVQLQTGFVPMYLFGNLDSHQTPWKFAITKIAQSTTTVTATVSYVSGGGGMAGIMPVVGQIIGVRKTTVGSGAANIDYTPITGISLTNGVGTITYTVATSQTVSTTNDTGELVALPREVPDSVIQGSASAPVAQKFTPDDADNSRCIFAECTFPTLPTSATVVLQAANVDEDSRYITLTNSAGNTNLAVVAAGAVTQAGAEYQFIMGKFLRMKVTAASGSFTLVGTIFA